MDYIDEVAAAGAGPEAEDDADAEVDAYDAGNLGICAELEDSAWMSTRSQHQHGTDADIVQQHILELSEAVVNTNSAKTYARCVTPACHICPGKLFLISMHRLWQQVKKTCIAHGFIRNESELECQIIDA